MHENVLAIAFFLTNYKTPIFHGLVKYTGVYVIQVGLGMDKVGCGSLDLYCMKMDRNRLNRSAEVGPYLTQPKSDSTHPFAPLDLNNISLKVVLEASTIAF